MEGGPENDVLLKSESLKIVDQFQKYCLGDIFNLIIILMFSNKYDVNGVQM